MRLFSALGIVLVLAGCATGPRVEEVAVVECEASPAGEVRNCALISQTVEGSEFGAAAVGIVARGKLRANPSLRGWEKFRTTVRGKPVG